MQELKNVNEIFNYNHEIMKYIMDQPCFLCEPEELYDKSMNFIIVTKFFTPLYGVEDNIAWHISFTPLYGVEDNIAWHIRYC